MTTLGTNIRARRQALGLSLKDLAAESGVSKGHISDLETGRIKDCTTDVLRRIGIALRLPWHKLAEGNGGGRG